MNRSNQESSSEEYWYWICQFGGWGTVLAFTAWASWRVFAVPMATALANSGIQMCLSIAATHLLRGYSKKRRWTYLGARSLLQHMIAAAVLLSAIVIAADYGILALLQSVGISLHMPVETPFALSAGLAFGNALLFLLLWMAAYFSLTLMRQRQAAAGEEARLRAALRTAELGLLKSQLNPHFLFNALNTVRALIVESPDRAQLAVTQLARTLRYSLNSARDEIVDLETELEIVEDYLGIETLRLAERLTIVKNVAANTMQSRIPIMLLQTLVENAVKHGISQLPAGGTLAVGVRMDGEVLVIEVSNDRPLIKSGSIPSDRVGLANASERLRLMIGTSASLALDLSHPTRAKATVRIPQLEAK